MIAKAVQASGSYMTDTAAVGGRDAAGSLVAPLTSANALVPVRVFNVDLADLVLG